jgi:hypothetical protein
MPLENMPNGSGRLAMKSVARLLVVSCAVIGAWPARAQAAPFIQNGDFEDVQIGSPFVSSNPVDIPGWTHSGTVGDGLLWAIGYHDGGGSVTVAGDGNQFVTLGGGLGAPGTASWTTTISGLVPGDRYTLSFEIANEGGNVGAPQSLILYGNFGGLILDPTPFITAPANSLDYWRIWLPVSLNNLVAFNSTTARLTFQVNNQGGNMGLDNVAITPEITPAPEPAALTLLGSALVGFGLLRRRTTTILSTIRWRLRVPPLPEYREMAHPAD